MRKKGSLGNKYIWICLTIFIAGIFIVYPHLISNKTLPVQGDGLGYFVSKSFWAESVKNGEFPLWNPYSSIGTPFWADVQQSVLSPFNILYLIFDAPLAFNIIRAIQLLIAGFSMFLLIREITEQYDIALVVGLIFMFSTCMGGRRIEHHTIINTVMFYPAIIFMLEKFRKQDKEIYMVISSILMAIQFLCGFTQICLYFNIYLFFYLIQILREKQYTIKKAIVLILKWVGLYVLLIGAQLIPTLILIMQSGKGSSSWGYFASYSYDLRIVLEMIFPDIYANNLQPFGPMNSSEFNTEIYIGIIALVYVLYEVFFHIKERRVHSLVMMAIVCFIFGMSPHIPLLGKFIYHVPLLGSFRCTGRILSLFSFTLVILLGLALSHIKEIETRINIIKINKIFLMILILICAVVSFIFSQPNLVSANNAYIKKMILAFIIAIGLLMMNLVLLLVTLKRDFSKWKTSILILMCFITIGDVLRFSDLSSGHIWNVDESVSTRLSEECNELLYKNSEEFYRSFMTIASPTDVSSGKMHMGEAQLSLYHKIYLYNSYLTFMDKKLNYWDLGETLYYPTFIQNVQARNDLISMLGIRYIYSEPTKKFKTSMPASTIDKEVYNVQNIAIPGGENIGTYSAEAVWLEPNSAYEIIFRADIENEFEFLHGDFYNVNYDSYEQENEFLEIGDGIWKTTLYTDAIPEDLVYFRILGKSKYDISIDDLSIYKLNQVPNGLEQIKATDDISIYENKNARQLFYIPEKVHVLPESEYQDYLKTVNDVDKVSYVTGTTDKIKVLDTNAVLNKMEIKNNSARVNVTANFDVFVNFSQLSYPGWNAYIDGKKTENYTVNNLIQGAVVPAGNHLLEFKFEPQDIKIGCIVSLAGVILLGGWVYEIRKKGRSL